MEKEESKNENKTSIEINHDDYLEKSLLDLEKFEMFVVDKSDIPNEGVIVNNRIDYQHRGNELAHLCLYDYISLIYKQMRSSRDTDIITEDSDRVRVDFE